MKIVIRILVALALFVPFSAFPADLTGPNLFDDDCLPKYPPPPVVKIKVRVPVCTDPGSTIQYRICVENCSTAEAHHVMVKNALPSNAKFVKADPMPAKLGDELQWQLGTIGGGAVREILLTLQPTNREDVKNCARVQFEHGQCVVTRQALHPGGVAPGIGLPPSIGEPGARLPKVTTVPDAKDVPDLDLQIVGPADRPANLDTKYTIILVNKSKVKATRVLVSAKMPKQLKVVKAGEPGQVVDNEVVWFLGTLEGGKSRAMDLTLKATEKGTFCFSVTADADLGVSKEKEFCTKFVGVAAMKIEMTDTIDPVFVGQKTTYPVTITNQGTAPLTNVQLRAFVPISLKLDKASDSFEKLPPVKEGQWIEFAIYREIPVGKQIRYEIFVEAMLPGVTIFEIQVSADQLDAGRLTEQESTTIVNDRN